MQDQCMEMKQEQTMLQRLGTRLDELLWRKDFEFCEIMSGMAALVWGIILAMPYSTFASSPTFLVFTHYVPEWLFAIVMMTLGLVQLSSLFFEIYPIRRWSCLIAAGVWAAISMAFLMGNPKGLGIGIYPLFMLMSGWAYMRIKRIVVYDEQ